MDENRPKIDRNAQKNVKFYSPWHGPLLLRPDGPVCTFVYAAKEHLLRLYLGATAATIEPRGNLRFGEQLSRRARECGTTNAGLDTTAQEAN